MQSNKTIRIFDGATAIVTGGASGIGGGLTDYFLRLEYSSLESVFRKCKRNLRSRKWGRPRVRLKNWHKTKTNCFHPVTF
jgi:hypothetical protein